MLNPTNHCLAFIDAVALMSFSVSNTSRDELRNKVAIVANAAKIFNVPITYRSWRNIKSFHPEP